MALNVPSLFAGSMPALPPQAASVGIANGGLDLTRDPIGWLILALFVLAYAFVVLEEHTGMRKSKPVMLAAALIWALIAWQAAMNPQLPAEFAAQAFERVFLEFAELFF